MFLLPGLNLLKLPKYAKPHFGYGRIQWPKPVSISKLGPFYAFTSITYFLTKMKSLASTGN